MDDVVQKLCDSLVTNPHDWVFDIYTFYNKNAKTQYWVGTDKWITKIFNGRNTHEVFSVQQGVKIFNAYVKARETQATLEQQKVIDSFKTEQLAVKPVSNFNFRFW